MPQSQQTPLTVFERYLAVDLHKAYVVVGGVNARLEVVLSPRRIELNAWPRWAQANLRPTDALVVESTLNAWDFYDQVTPLVGQAVVANPRLVKLIASGRVKTDKVDTLSLAKLLATGFIPTVWVPPLEVREARGLLAHRRRLVHNRTMVTNRLQSVLQRHNLAGPDGAPSVSPTGHGGTPCRYRPPRNCGYGKTWQRWDTWPSRSLNSTPRSCG